VSQEIITYPGYVLSFTKGGKAMKRKNKKSSPKTTYQIKIKASKLILTFTIIKNN